MERVWVVMTGEAHEGGHIVSMHATAEGGQVAFHEQMVTLRERWGREPGPITSDDGDTYGEVACDWVSLECYDVLA